MMICCCGALVAEGLRYRLCNATFLALIQEHLLHVVPHLSPLIYCELCNNGLKRPHNTWSKSSKWPDRAQLMCETERETENNYCQW